MPELWCLLDLGGATITTDAMGIQTEIADAIIADGGSYLLAVKDSQPTLHEDIKILFYKKNKIHDPRTRVIGEAQRSAAETTAQVLYLE